MKILAITPLARDIDSTAKAALRLPIAFQRSLSSRRNRTNALGNLRCFVRLSGGGTIGG
jgi:hypothetical protein